MMNHTASAPFDLAAHGLLVSHGFSLLPDGEHWQHPLLPFAVQVREKWLCLRDVQGGYASVCIALSGSLAAGGILYLLAAHGEKR